LEKRVESKAELEGKSPSGGKKWEKEIDLLQ